MSKRLRGQRKREATRLAKEQRKANRRLYAKSTKKSYVMLSTQDKLIKALYREFLSTQEYLSRTNYKVNAYKQTNKALRQLGINVGAALTQDNIMRLRNTMSILTNALKDKVASYVINQQQRAEGKHAAEDKKSQFEKWKETREKADRRRGITVDESVYAEAYDIFANDLYHQLLELHLIDSDQPQRLAEEYVDLEMSDIEDAMCEMLRVYKSKENEHEEILSPSNASKFLHDYLDNIWRERYYGEEKASDVDEHDALNHFDENGFYRGWYQ